MEHRWGDRIAVDRPVRISGAGITGTGTLRNLSVSGAFIETSLPLAGLVTVRIRIPDGLNGGETRHEATGFVVRWELTGFGIEWCELAALHPAELLAPRGYAIYPSGDAADPPRLAAS